MEKSPKWQCISQVTNLRLFIRSTKIDHLPEQAQRKQSPIPTIIIRPKIADVIKENSLAIKIEQINEIENKRDKIKVRVTNFTWENITKKVANTINFIKVVIKFDETKVWYFIAIVTKDDVLEKLNIEQVQ